LAESSSEIPAEVREHVDWSKYADDGAMEGAEPQQSRRRRIANAG